MERQAVTARIRAFNRYYTDMLGLLGRYFLKSKFSLTEVRVMYEIAHNAQCTAKAIRSSMNIDAGYLSRILAAFSRKGMIEQRPAREDRRFREIELTGKGRKIFSEIDATQERSIENLVERLSDPERDELLIHMERIRELLEKR